MELRAKRQDVCKIAKALKSSMLRELSELGLLCPCSLGTQTMTIPVRRHQRRCEDKEAGQMWVRLTVNPNKPVAPKVLLAYVHLLDSKRTKTV